jgi:hypothetical protein
MKHVNPILTYPVQIFGRILKVFNLKISAMPPPKPVLVLVLASNGKTANCVNVKI